MKKELIKMIITLTVEGTILLGVATYLAYINGIKIGVPIIQNICQMIG